MIGYLKSAQATVGGSVTTLTVPYSIAIGDVVVVTVSSYAGGASNTPISVIDDGSNVYTLRIANPSTAGNTITSIYSTVATASATSVIVNLTGTQNVNGITAICATYTGVGGIGNTGIFTNSTGTNSFAITGNLTSVNNWMVSSFAIRTGPATATAGTLRVNTVSGTPNSRGVLIDNTGSLAPICSCTTLALSVVAIAFLELIGTPGLTSITPNAGAPGTTVAITLTGTNLTGATAINLSGTGITVTNIVVINDTTVTANFVIASGTSSGIQNVTIIAPAGTSNSVAFNVTLLAPVLSSMTPNTISVVNPTFTVTFHGTNLTGTTAVNVGGAPIVVSNITVVSSTVVTANFTIHGTTTGTFNISLTTPNGTSNTVPFTLTLRPAGQAIFYDRIASMWAFRTRRK